MFEFVQTHQLGLMLVLTSVCVVIALFAAITKALPRNRKIALVYLELTASFLLFFDRLAYVYRGDSSFLGFRMVRISNFMVFILMLGFFHAVNRYLADLAINEMGLHEVPLRIRVVEILVGLGWLLVVISQFTDIYYYFDENNNYVRGVAYYISYLIPLIIIMVHFSLIANHFDRLSKGLKLSFIAYFVLPVITAVLQYFLYGLSLIDFSLVMVAVFIYMSTLKDMNDTIERSNMSELNLVKKERSLMQHAFDQAATAVASAVDSRDPYSKGHSIRVAQYSRMIAMKAGLDEQACYEVYYAGLLHDIGKIRISDTILNREIAPSEADKEMFRKHTEIGAKILEGISDYPYLTYAARSHHERFDGTGYPDGLKGEQIPLYARIVTVADVYDTLTTDKKNRNALPQGKVREEFVRGTYKQFDPKFSTIMIKLIDEDTDYEMRASDEEEHESSESFDISRLGQMSFVDYKRTVSDGIKITENMTTIRLASTPDEDAVPKHSIPALIVFDSYDGCIHNDERRIRNLHYVEFAEIWFDGNTISTKARNMKTEVTGSKEITSDTIVYEIEACRVKDHMRIKVRCKDRIVDTVIALPDGTRSAYIGIAGEHCKVKDVTVETAKEPVEENYIPRIAEEINIVNLIAGDIPSVQSDGYRTAVTSGVQVFDGMRLLFHTRCLPSSNIVSACPYIVLYSSDDSKAGGRNYREYACIRLDGEEATENDGKTGSNELIVQKTSAFEGWDSWKKFNKRGYEVEIHFTRKRNKIIMTTVNAGIAIRNTTIVEKGTNDIYAALTGEQCAVMDIRVLSD